MKHWKYFIVVCLCSIIPKVLSIDIESKDNSKSENDLKMDILYDIGSGHVVADPCASNPCQNGGTCAAYQDTFMCLCKAPFRGRTCENDPCASNPCKNGGTCAPYEDKFLCMCPTPFRGLTCENDPCASNPCQNGGTCAPYEDTFMCLCKDPFIGRTCEDNPCADNPCKNNGTCAPNKDTFMCLCPATFRGPLCENECDCGENADCFFNSPGGKECVCHRGFRMKSGVCTQGNGIGPGAIAGIVIGCLVGVLVVVGGVLVFRKRCTSTTYA